MSPEQIAWFFYLGVPALAVLVGVALVSARLSD